MTKNLKGNRKVNTVVWTALVVVVLLAVTSWWLHKILHRPAPDTGGDNVEIIIEPGMTLHQVAALLEENRLVTNRSEFRWAAWIMQAERKIQPGCFLIPRGVNNSEILRYLQRPGIMTRDVTIPEGLTIKQIAGLLQREIDVDSVEFISLCEDSTLTLELGIDAGRLEGYLFPDTYNLYLESAPRTIIKRMVAKFFDVFNDSLKARLDRTGMTVHKAVILASIIQGEVMIDEEAPLVSVVYHNRLRHGMLLAADPTIQYIIPDGPRRLLNKDLEIDSPYNTYKYRGLPPGPVNNPGRVAIEAAVNPAEENYLYFVAKGDGSHAFNHSHTGHVRDKQRFQQVRRQVARKKRLEKIGGGR